MSRAVPSFELLTATIEGDSVRECWSGRKLGYGIEGKSVE